jgi:DNA-binding CsgD family transcriptional regulator
MVRISDLERAVISHIVFGFSISEIATRLDLSTRTILKLLDNVNRKIGDDPVAANSGGGPAK